MYFCLSLIVLLICFYLQLIFLKHKTTTSGVNWGGEVSDNGFFKRLFFFVYLFAGKTNRFAFLLFMYIIIALRWSWTRLES